MPLQHVQRQCPKVITSQAADFSRRASIFNMALACSECNHAVGNMAVKQKIAFAMQKRKQESLP